MQIPYCIDRYLASRGAGDVKKLKSPRTDFRIRCGDYRVFFDRVRDNATGSPRSQPPRSLPLRRGEIQP
jgi:hypothetical protein